MTAGTTQPWGAHDLTVRRGRRTALADVSLEVAAGAVTAVIGGDGAGKSTLLRALAGVVRASSGSVSRPPRERIGYVAGASGLYADLSVAENIAFVAGAYGLAGAELERRTEVLLARTGLEGVDARLAGRLSGGMRQKLAFALAMLHEPDLLVLDEPTTGVDPVSRAELWRLIAGAAAGGAAVVVSTTYLDEALRASRVLALDAGRPLAEGAADDVVAALRPKDDRGTTGSTGATPAAGSATAALLQTKAVERRFGAFTAVADVDLSVHAGEVVGLLGANGAGKTTLIRMALGLLRPSAGTVRLFGAPPTRAARLRLGYVPQGLGLWEDLTVNENLAFVAAAFGCALPTLEPDLAAVADALVRDLSQGLKRRLAFAAALAHDPEVLVLDEPTSGVDPAARARLWETVHGAARAGAGILATTHYLEEAEQCDRLVVLSGGRVAAAGTLAAIVGDARAVLVTTARWEAAFAALESAGLAAALVGRGLRVPGGDAARVREALGARGVAADLQVVPATFEETFVSLARDREYSGETPPTTPASGPATERTTP